MLGMPGGAAALVGLHVVSEDFALAHEDRALDGDGVALGGLGAVGRYYENVAKLPGGIYEGFQASGGDAVVVGY